MTPDIDRDPANKRTVSMWEECGLAFRMNAVEPGGRIPLHAHANPHVAILHGNFQANLVSPEGVAETRQAHRKESIEAWWQHEFIYLDTEGVGSVLCICPADRGF